MSLRQDERGLALITVLGVAMTMFAFATVIAASSLNNLGQVRRERHLEAAIHLADSGVDHTLFLLTESPAYHTGEVLPPGGFFSNAAEKQWVLQQAASATESNGRLQAGPEGEWVAIRPQGSSVIYGVGYVPSKAEANAVRVVRSEYVMGATTSLAGILFGGPVQISGNPDIEGSVHSNGDVIANGKPKVTGSLSGSGSCSGCTSNLIGDQANSGGGKPEQQIAVVEPRDYYTSSEYDLCPDGKVRAGPAYSGAGANATETPCQGAVLATATSAAYRGWRRTGTHSTKGALWESTANQRFDGVYYAYQGTAIVSGNPGTPANPWEATIIAEATTSGGQTICPQVGGDIELTGSPRIRYHSKAQPILLLASRDLHIAGSGRGEGTVLALEQIQISGNKQVDGSVISAHLCDSPQSDIHSSLISGNPKVVAAEAQQVTSSQAVSLSWSEL